MQPISHFAQFVGPSGAIQIFGVKLLGVTSENGKKLLFSLVLIAAMWLLAWGIAALAALALRQRSHRVAFWTKQTIRLVSVAVLFIGLCSIWFDNPARLATALGLVTAGLAFALQKVVTALAAYLVVLRGKTFSVGDRIAMGGMRGDVIELGFIQTTIMERGEPPREQGDDPAMWVRTTARANSLSSGKK